MTPRGHNMRHRYDEHRQGQRCADPEAAAHVLQLRVVFLHIASGGDGLRFKRHAALGAVAGMVLLDLRVHRTGVDGFRGRLPRRIAFQGHAAFRAIPRLVGFHSGTHRTKVFGGGGRCHRCVLVTVMGMVVMRVSVGACLAATTGMFFRSVLVFVAAVVSMFAFAAATIAVRFGGRALRKELLPAVLAAKVKRLALALGMESRRFIHRHSADWVFGHGFTFGLLLGA